MSKHIIGAIAALVLSASTPVLAQDARRSVPEDFYCLGTVGSRPVRRATRLRRFADGAGAELACLRFFAARARRTLVTFHGSNVWTWEVQEQIQTT